MAGSKVWVLYTDDAGNRWATEMDESNANAGGFTAFPATAPAIGTGATKYMGVWPSRWKMRYSYWRSNNGKISRKIYFASRTNNFFQNGGSANFATLAGVDGDQKISLPGSLTVGIGERRVLPRATDTGLKDDNTDDD